MSDLSNLAENKRIYLYLAKEKDADTVSSFGALWDRVKPNPYLNHIGCYFLPLEEAFDKEEDIMPYLPDEKISVRNVNLTKDTFYYKKSTFSVADTSIKKTIYQLFHEDHVLLRFLTFYTKNLNLSVPNALLAFSHGDDKEGFFSFNEWMARGYKVTTKDSGINFFSLKEFSAITSCETALKRLSRYNIDTTSIGQYNIYRDEDNNYVIKRLVFADSSCNEMLVDDNLRYSDIRAFFGNVKNLIELPVGIQAHFASAYASQNINSLVGIRVYKGFHAPYSSYDTESLHQAFALLDYLYDIPLSFEDDAQDTDALCINRRYTPNEAMILLLDAITEKICPADNEPFANACILFMMLTYFGIPTTVNLESTLSLGYIAQFSLHKSHLDLQRTLEFIRYRFASFHYLLMDNLVDISNIQEMEGYRCPCFERDAMVMDEDVLNAQSNLGLPDAPQETSITWYEEQVASMHYPNDNTAVNDHDRYTSLSTPLPIEKAERGVSLITPSILPPQKFITEENKQEWDDSASNDTDTEQDGSNDANRILVYEAIQDVNECPTDGTLHLILPKHIEADDNPYRFEYGTALIGATGIELTFNLTLVSIAYLKESNLTRFVLAMEDIGARKYDNVGNFTDGIENEYYNFSFFKNNPYESVTRFGGEIFFDNKSSRINSADKFFVEEMMLNFSEATIQLSINIREQENLLESPISMADGTDSEYKEHPAPSEQTVSPAPQSDDSLHIKVTENRTDEEQKPVPKKKPDTVYEAVSRRNREYIKRGDTTPRTMVATANFNELERKAITEGIYARLRTPLPLSDYAKAVITVPFLKEQANILSAPKLARLYENWKQGWLQADRQYQNRVSSKDLEKTTLLAVTRVEDAGKKERNYISCTEDFTHALFANPHPLDDSYVYFKKQLDYVIKNPCSFASLLYNDYTYRFAMIPLRNLGIDEANDGILFDTTFLTDFLKGAYRTDNSLVHCFNDFSLHSKKVNRILSFLNVDLYAYNDRTVNFYVSECGEFPSLGFFRTGLNFKEAIDMFSKLPNEEGLGKAIGVTVDNGSPVPFSTQIYPLNFVATQCEPFRSNSAVNKACAFVEAQMEADNLFKKRKEFIDEPLPSSGSSLRTNVIVDIYQLKDEKDIKYRFRDYNYLVNTMKLKVLPKNYNKVVSMKLDRVSNMADILNDFFALGNMRLERFTPYVLEGMFMREISTGDVISITTTEIYDSHDMERTISYYVNSSGFVMIPSFTDLPSGRLVLSQKNNAFLAFNELYEVDPYLAVWEASSKFGVSLTVRQAKLIASIDGMLLAMPKDDRSLKRYLKKGLKLVSSMDALGADAFVQINCSRYPNFDTGCVFTLKDFDAKVQTEKIAIKKYYFEHGQNSYIGDDELRLNIFVVTKDENGEPLVYTLPIVLFLGNLSFSDFLSFVQAEMNDMIRNIKKHVEYGKIGTSMLTSEKKLELKKAMENLIHMSELMNRSLKAPKKFTPTHNRK